MTTRITSMGKSVFFLCLLSVSMILVNTAAVSQNNELPELGDASAKYLSPDQENIYGQEFLRFLLRQNAYIDDYELIDFLQTLGDRVGASASLRGTPLTFNILKNNVLNAFAVPGGYITFHTGLINNAESESELASVVGHEIAHLSQRHLPRLIARSNENRIPAILAIIGSILIGGQAGLAGLTATNAAVASNQLSYTRSFEREADSIGIQLLANAGFDPSGMAQFFGKLERHTRHDSTDVLEFLRTHPLSYTRVAESESRAAEYPPVRHESSLEFYLTKAKIRALYIERQEDPSEYFITQMKSTTPFEKDAGTYGMSVWLVKSRKYDQAMHTIKPLLDKYKEHPWIESLAADIDLHLGNTSLAVERYKSLINQNPEKVYLNYKLIDTYLSSNDNGNAKKLVRYQLRRHPENYILYKYLSRANAKLNLLAEAHQSDAEYHAILGNYGAAIESLKLAQRETSEDGYLAQSIQSRLKSLEEKQSLRKRIIDG